MYSTPTENGACRSRRAAAGGEPAVTRAPLTWKKLLCSVGAGGRASAPVAGDTQRTTTHERVTVDARTDVATSGRPPRERANACSTAVCSRPPTSRAAMAVPGKQGGRGGDHRHDRDEPGAISAAEHRARG